MCGIYAELRAGNTPASITEQTAIDGLRHRGPDDHWSDSWPGATVATTRLAIVNRDVASSASNPQADPVKVLFNGEIWNYQRIGEQLGLAAPFTEIDVIRAGYALRGARFIRALDGMYAIVLVDDHEDRLVAARDPVGIKPLYFSQTRWSVAVASDLSLLARAHRRDRLDARYIHSREICGFADCRTSMLAGLRALGPGEIMTVDASRSGLRVASSQYQPIPTCDADAVSDVDAVLGALESSLRRCLDHRDTTAVGDPGIAMLLSGGIDSSLMAALAAERMGPDQLRFYCAGPEDSPDWRWAAYVAGRLERPLERLDVGALSDIDQERAARLMGGQPALGLYGVFQRLRQVWPDGKIVLCGEGADEIFGGYPWHLAARRRLMEWSRRAEELGVELPPMVLPNQPDEISALVHVLSLDRTHQLVDRHLVPFDHAAMAFGFELRVPYLGSEVVRLALQIQPRIVSDPVEQKLVLRQGLRQLIPDAPDEFYTRLKVGFPYAFRAARPSMTLTRWYEQALAAILRT